MANWHWSSRHHFPPQKHNVTFATPLLTRDTAKVLSPFSSRFREEPFGFSSETGGVFVHTDSCHQSAFPPLSTALLTQIPHTLVSFKGPGCWEKLGCDAAFMGRQTHLNANCYNRPERVVFHWVRLNRCCITDMRWLSSIRLLGADSMEIV